MTPDMDIFRATNPQEASLYDRQAGLPLHVPSSVTIVGVGGVGSWVAYFFALTGVKSLVLIDPDRVEESNRNRTPFHVWHVGDYKADALVEVIMECREDCEIETYNKRYEELTAVEKARSDDTELFFDCRDMVSTLDRQTPITGGYDGSEVTLHVKPDYNKVFSANDEEGYRTTPSYVVPPAFIALCIVNYVCLEKHQRGGNMDEFCFNVEMTKLVRKLAGKKRFRPRGQPGSNEPTEEQDAQNNIPSPASDDDMHDGIPIRRGLSLNTTRLLPYETLHPVVLNTGESMFHVRQMRPDDRLIDEIIDEEGLSYLQLGPQERRH
jgi:hypothetical protein